MPDQNEPSPPVALPLTVAALYHFTRFDEPASLREPLLAHCLAHSVKGTLLLAHEGINGTLAGSRDGIDAALAHIRALPGCSSLEWKESQAGSMPFGRMRVRLKREIVSMGQPDVDPATRTGHYVPPTAWNELINDPNTVVIDTRNDYEVAIGTFAGAINPGARSFREFPAWWKAHQEQFAGKRIAMFCTGGIRCEKSTNYLLGQGVSDVFHLKGGILKYLEEVPEESSLWHGECFVFDDRVSVGHGLAPGDLTNCGACRRPVRAEDLDHPAYEEGVACPSCEGDYSPADRERFRMRHRQMQLAAARGERHLGRTVEP